MDIKAVLLILGMSIITSFVGCFLLWRRLTFFADSLSHGSLIGIVLAIALFGSGLIGAGVVAFIFVIALWLPSPFPKELWLSILAYTGLSLGILVKQFFPHLNILKIFIGDILHADSIEVCLVISTAGLLGFWIIKNFQDLILLTLDEDLAKSDGINVKKLNFILLSLIAFGIIISLKTMGNLITPGLFTLMPAMIYPFSKSTKTMLIGTGISTFIHMSLGMILSSILHCPIGPLIVSLAFLSFLISLGLHRFLTRA